MIYTGFFRDINDKQYKVVITTSNGSGNNTVILGTDPFITELETSESHLYKPCKYSSATIRIVTNDYLFDIYSSKAQDNKVVLYDNNNNIKWVGYITPNLYSMGYENIEEELEIEAIDALSTLQYYNYTTVGTDKDIVNFKQIIDKLLTKCNAYTEYYVSNNILVNNNDKVLDNLYISEQNFYDEDDEPMTMQEVLEEIAQYIGYSVMADGDKVYFLDYDAIANGNNTYYKYSLTNTAATPSLVTLSHNHAINGNSYAENGQQISLDNTYNKVTVRDSLYSFDSIIPSIWDESMLENYGGEWNYVQEVNEEFRGKYKCFFKYFKNKNYKSYYYNKATRTPVSLSSVNYTTTQNYIGATICKHFSEKVSDYNNKYNNINFTDYVLLHLHNKQDINNKLPMFELQINDSLPSFLGGSTYLIIKGNFLFLDRENEMYIIQGYTNKDDNFNPAKLYITCKLQIGNQFWNGTAWTTTDSTFNLFFDNNGQTSHCINQIFPVKNNITWDMGLDEEGYAIPMPNVNKVITGKPKFILYEPQKLDSSYRCDAVWLSNFDIVAKVQNFQKDVDKDSDTEYTNIIDEEFVNELRDVEMKICTWDNKEANYSAVCYKNGSDYLFVDKVKNTATNQTLRFEEHLIYKLVTQYSTPSAILNLSLKNNIKLYSTLTDKYLNGKLFIVDSITEKYSDASQEIKLIEKK